MISPETLQKALAGEDPVLGHALSAGELGRRLAAHRRGRYAGQPFTRAAISLYKQQPAQQSADFAEAFMSWRAAERLRQADLRVKINGLTVDEMLSEGGYLQQVGGDPVKALVAVGQLRPGMLISVNGVARSVECLAEVAVCGCGQAFVKRSWNQVRCSACALARRRMR